MRKGIVVALGALFIGPVAAVLSVILFMSPAALASCMTSGALLVGQVPQSLTATTRAGTTIALNHQQLTHAATIIKVGSSIDGVGRDGIRIALMAALTESTLRMLANPAYPDSFDYPNDGAGYDHDSLGLFQMRPVSGWGTVYDLMDPAYQARAFFGGPDGPNYPSPRGLLDISAWQMMDPGAAAQAVEVSAYPDRYQNYQPVAEAVIIALTRPAPSVAGSSAPLDNVPETSRIVFPLPTGTWVRSGGFGPRIDPITFEPDFHHGVDLSAPGGTPILALADGVVSAASYTESGGGFIAIEHTIDGQRIASVYIHMWADGIFVTVGEVVTAGQHIGDVGTSGHSTGNHLHFELRPGGTSSPSIDPEPWLDSHSPEDLLAGSESSQCMI